MRVYYLTPGTWARMIVDLAEAPPIHTGEWQAMNTSTSKAHATHELEDVTIVVDEIPADPSSWANTLNPNLPWAEDHFLERVSGFPYNPAPSHLNWPYAVRGNAMHTDAADKFDHTYPERFWPRHAGHDHPPVASKSWVDPISGVPVLTTIEDRCGGTPGIRFHYGDLSDVVDLLVRSPLTRQAFLPVWFPEDTGAVDGQRVPCTLGYHMMIREGKLTIRYYIRSCDIYRHFTNDVYMAGRLAQWVCDEVNRRSQQHIATPGSLVMHVSSLHMFVADERKMRAKVEEIIGDPSES